MLECSCCPSDSKLLRLTSPRVFRHPVCNSMCSYENSRNTGSTSLRMVPPDPLADPQLYTEMIGLLDSESDPSVLFEKLRKVAGNSKPRFPPPEVLPCANTKVAKYRACPNPGNKACSSCRLVSYCSKVYILFYRLAEYSHSSQECQSAHWRAHKSGAFKLKDFW